ncbi:MAG: FecR family protein [Candidatus Omnitrophota bacterium]
MNFIFKTRLISLMLALLLVAGANLPAFSQGLPKEVSITAMSGEVLVLKTDATDWEPAQPGDILSEGDSIKTLEGASARLQFPLRGTIDLNEKTSMMINRLEAAEGGKIETSLSRGRIKTNIEKFLDKKSTFEVRTPTAVAGVVGTEFYLNVTEESEAILEESEAILKDTIDSNVVNE